MKQQAYSESHKDRLNLVLHLFAVPLFWLASLSCLAFLAMGAWVKLSWSAAGLGLSLGTQAIGHKRESRLPNPFNGPLDFITRIFREQFYHFPLLVLRGAWWRNFRHG